MFRLRAGVRAVRRSRRQREGRRIKRGRVQENRRPTRLSPRFHSFEATGPSRHQAGERISVCSRHE